MGGSVDWIAFHSDDVLFIRVASCAYFVVHLLFVLVCIL